MAGRSRRSLLSLDCEVDPVFRCQLCQTPGYTDGTLRSKCPLTPGGHSALNWVNHQWCWACDYTLRLCYRFDLAVGGRFHQYEKKVVMLIKLFSEDDELKIEFLDRKKSLAAALGNTGTYAVCICDCVLLCCWCSPATQVLTCCLQSAWAVALMWGYPQTLPWRCVLRSMSGGLLQPTRSISA